MLEVEVKAVVTDPATVRDRLLTLNAKLQFAGRMTDLRVDRDGELSSRQQTLRVRLLEEVSGESHCELTWKAPTMESTEGHKQREEIGVDVASQSQSLALLAAMGYRPVHRIDRYVEGYTIAGTTCRLEWYPRMDTLLEVEGPPESIESVVSLLGFERCRFSADPLEAFQEGYRARTGESPILNLADLESEPAWPDQ